MDAETLEFLAAEMRRVRQEPDYLKFSSKDEAIVHAQHLARLQPGDVVFIKAKNEPCEQSVFVGPDRENRHAFVICLDSDGVLRALSAPFGCIRFTAE